MSTEASNKQAEEQGEESILSTELAAELGGDVGTLVATKKKKGKKADGPTELVKMLAKQLSKKAQKRIDQIKRRKDTEARRSEFLDTIHEHEISDTHRQLLTSSREIGQAQTVRQLLSSIFRKQAAGLQLTQGEAQLLYRSGDADADFEFPPELLSSLSAGAGGAGAGAGDDDLWADGEGEGMEGVTGGASDLLFSFDDIIPPSERVEKGRKGKRRKSKKGGADESEDAATTSATVASSSASNDKSASASASASAPTCAPTSAPTPAPASVPTSTPASVGSSLLEQLKRLKEGRAPLNQTPADALAAVAAKVTAAVVKAAAVAEEMARVLPVRGPYQAEEIEIPVTELGEIRAARGKGEGGKIQVDRMQGTQGMQEQGREGIPSSRVWVLRSAAVQAARMELPVCAMEQEIVEAINCSKDDVIVLCGETGSGKSTQVPQFLYEAGYGQGGLIGITQPRRVAVTSTAARVAYEMSGEESVGTVGAGAGVGAEAVGAGETEGSKKSKKAKKAGKEAKDGAEQGTGGRGFGIGGGSIGGLVGHQIRFDKTTSLSTRIKFMTDGILLKEVASDLLLRKYRVVILDEAHERNINTDVLLGMLSRALPLRRAQALLEQVRYDNLDPVERSLYAEPLKPLKLIIMSATMRVEDFLNPRLFPTPPPVVRVNARQYPVTTHFSKRTETTNYLKETHRKVCQIHRKLPDGGVLVFLTGKKEILYMCHKLNKTLNKRRRLGVEGGVGVGEVEGGAGEVGMGDGEVEEGEEGLTGLGASAKEGRGKGQQGPEQEQGGCVRLSGPWGRRGLTATATAG
ncbi:hypothetical protein B484DRAFT_173441 [Ochromonadaceae sp. CCMP2298]|nr:hypothetical protein B484DRAFT_173441 [Ochromonadaceae sp. CCMP2298]